MYQARLREEAPIAPTDLEADEIDSEIEGQEYQAFSEQEVIAQHVWTEPAAAGEDRRLDQYKAESREELSVAEQPELPSQNVVLAVNAPVVVASPLVLSSSTENRDASGGHDREARFTSGPVTIPNGAYLGVSVGRSAPVDAGGTTVYVGFQSAGSALPPAVPIFGNQALQKGVPIPSGPSKPVPRTPLGSRSPWDPIDMSRHHNPWTTGRLP
jgi:hypothetical protein